jgi:hypothetical protein
MNWRILQSGVLAQDQRVRDFFKTSVRNFKKSQTKFSELQHLSPVKAKQPTLVVRSETIKDELTPIAK